MSTRQNTIGVINWGGMWAGTTGDQIALIIPAFFQENHVPFLESILSGRLEELFGSDGVVIELQPGQLANDDRGTSYEPGTIGLIGITEPWPDPSDFRKALDDAFAQAAEVEFEQMKKADALVAHLQTGISE